MRILCPLLSYVALSAPLAAADDVLVAAVGDDPIYARHVDQVLEQITGDGQVNPAVLPVVKAQVLAEIIDRRLVLAYARRTGTGAPPEQVEAALAAMSAQLAAEKRSLADELARRGITEADLRRQLAWNLTWPKYLVRYATEARLEQHFAAHRREFDGTEVSVSHVLLAPAPGAAAGAIDELVRRAEAIRRQIDSGELTFEEAARRYSSGPSREQGGRLGFITRRGSMIESFSRAAFSLGPGQISRPVTTRFGVHLIRVDEIKPGKKQLADVSEQVEDSLARELTHKLGDHERAHTPVEFTGRGPYFKPGSGELVAP
jgi:parvulin-like peptidyl-prolyl isomerase